MSHLSRLVFVGRLNFRTIEDDVRFHFEQCGRVVDCKIVCDGNGRSKGFGFVSFERPQDAELAVEKLDGSVLDGKNIHVEFNKEILRKKMETKQMEREVMKSFKDVVQSDSSSSSSEEEEREKRHHHHHRRRSRHSSPHSHHRRHH